MALWRAMAVIQSFQPLVPQRGTILTSRADGSPKMVPKSLGDDHERFRRAVATTRA